MQLHAQVQPRHSQGAKETTLRSPCIMHTTLIGERPPPPPKTPPGNGRACPSARKDMGVDRGPCQDPSPQHGDPDPGEGRIQANCGVWLTATGRGHRDTQAPTHRTRRGDTCPGAPEKKLIRQRWDTASQYPDKSTQASGDQPNNDVTHIRVFQTRQKTKPSSSLPPCSARRIRR